MEDKMICPKCECTAGVHEHGCERKTEKWLRDMRCSCGIKEELLKEIEGMKGKLPSDDMWNKWESGYYQALSDLEEIINN